MHAQQCAQLLVRCRRSHHPAAITQRHREAPQLAFPAILGKTAEMAPVHLSLLARCRLKSLHRNRLGLLALRVKPVLQNRVTAAVVALPQLAQKYRGVPDTRP